VPADCAGIFPQGDPLGKGELDTLAVVADAMTAQKTTIQNWLIVHRKLVI
jgi:hypothetical protein